MTTNIVPVALLWWLPVGAGGHLVRHTSAWWEFAEAVLARRRPEPLFHAALELVDSEGRTVIEMAPAWGAGAVGDRGVVTGGPVGSRVLGRSRFFRYEVRCWRGGRIPDRRFAIASPVVVGRGGEVVEGIRDDVARSPALVWGRTVSGTADMWNSNSLVAWLLVRAGVETSTIRPPADGRAPGWSAGVAVAHQS